MSDDVSAFRPAIPDPYPEKWRRISGFRYESRLMLARTPKALKIRRTRETSYVVAEPYTVSFEVDGERRELTVPAGMLTDLVSVPAFARSIVGRVGPHLEAAIVHDYLFIAWQLLEKKPLRRDFDFANEVMFAGLKAARIGFFQRWSIETALTSFGVAWGVYKETDARLFIELDRRFERFRSASTGLLDAPVVA